MRSVVIVHVVLMPVFKERITKQSSFDDILLLSPCLVWNLFHAEFEGKLTFSWKPRFRMWCRSFFQKCAKVFFFAVSMLPKLCNSFDSHRVVLQKPSD